MVNLFYSSCHGNLHVLIREVTVDLLFTVNHHKTSFTFDFYLFASLDFAIPTTTCTYLNVGIELLTDKKWSKLFHLSLDNSQNYSPSVLQMMF